MYSNGNFKVVRVQGSRRDLSARLVLGLTLALGLVTAMPARAADQPSGLAELGARWWQWAFSFPAAVNPLTDPTGERCTFGQAGTVWFLGGSFSSATVQRDCSPVPVGAAILIPALNAECSSIEGDGQTEAQLRTCARGLIQGATGQAIVDDKHVPVLRSEFAAFPLRPT